MKQKQHQMMGYDRAITMFSPDGRLLQVEYAKKAVGLGNTAVGIVTKEGVILITDKRIANPLVVPDSVEKIFEIDEHLMITASGIVSDARVLIEDARQNAQQNRVSYDEPIDTLLVTKDICSTKQMTTQGGGLRPFGASLLIAGIDTTGSKLYTTDPTGIYNEYKANVIGEGSQKGRDILQAEYKEDMTAKQGFNLGLKILKKVIGKEDFNVKRVDAAIVKKSTKKIKKLSDSEIENHL